MTEDSLKIRIDVGSLGLPIIALIDTRANTNTISFDLSIGKLHLRPTQQSAWNGFLGQVTTMLDTCRLPIYIFGYNCVHEFHVFWENALDTQIILG